jgi:hypothetical protein
VQCIVQSIDVVIHRFFPIGLLLLFGNSPFAFRFQKIQLSFSVMMMAKKMIPAPTAILAVITFIQKQNSEQTPEDGFQAHENAGMRRSSVFLCNILNQICHTACDYTKNRIVGIVSCGNVTSMYR